MASGRIAVLAWHLPVHIFSWFQNVKCPASMCFLYKIRREIHMKKLKNFLTISLENFKKFCRKYDWSLYLTWTPFILTAFFQSFNLAFSPMYMNFFGVTKLWSSSSMHSLCIPGQVNNSLCNLPLKFPQDTSSIFASGSYLPKKPKKYIAKKKKKTFNSGEIF